jgi:hypothetical protein
MHNLTGNESTTGLRKNGNPGKEKYNNEWYG